MLQGRHWLATRKVLCCSYVVCVHSNDVAAVPVAAVLLHPLVLRPCGSYL